MKKLLLTLLTTVAMSQVAMAEQVKLKYSSFLPATTQTNNVTIPRLKAKLEELSGGNLSVETYFGGTLGAGPKTQMRLVKNGVADFAEVPVPYTPGRIKGITVFELPFVVKNNVDSSVKTLDLINDKLITGTNRFVVLGALQAGPYLIHTREKIESIDDLKGKRLRVSGAIQSAIVEEFGGVPVANIPATQIAENLSRKLLDGALVDMGNVYNFRIEEETKYHVTNLELGAFSVLFLMNKDKYNELSADNKKAIDAVKGEWFTKELGKEMDIQASMVLDKLKADKSQHLIELPKADLEKAHAKMQKVIDEWTKKNPRNAEIYKAATAQ
ncbi:MAG: TRAP transporter substrate-binding protein DctP [Gammaproteobacteria bacterium]|nr:TRAP transporter substrate-binding protein DctP [Gammaproteobacteria bacterium]